MDRVTKFKTAFKTALALVIAVGIALALLILLCWVGALSVQVETLGTGGQPQLLVGVLKELVQPFRW